MLWGKVFFASPVGWVLFIVVGGAAARWLLLPGLPIALSFALVGSNELLRVLLVLVETGVRKLSRLLEV